MKDKLDVDKLKHVSVDLKKLGHVVEKEVLENQNQIWISKVCKKIDIENKMPTVSVYTNTNCY